MTPKFQFLDENEDEIRLWEAEIVIPGAGRFAAEGDNPLEAATALCEALAEWIDDSDS